MVSSKFLPLSDIFKVFYKDRCLEEEGESVEFLHY